MGNYTGVECPRQKVDCQYSQLELRRVLIHEEQHKEECPKFPQK